ncbi:hypothetical protein M7I_7284 [Glarea lozoyensis 74030]|uniref:Uncharacterized protein n=1 Tax=Glarea lozoyensis (strain ATCC 74030 / MF5533) TaxID=1104152 RepID=H0EWV9_GLAL7|nr:hypothetical protein M7I_7284 [Glarea lozoyensis 74030]
MHIWHDQVEIWKGRVRTFGGGVGPESGCKREGRVEYNAHHTVELEERIRGLFLGIGLFAEIECIHGPDLFPVFDLCVKSLATTLHVVRQHLPIAINHAVFSMPTMKQRKIK